jgi:tRNA (adenine57-N1/adenine58-N1)-methyltransferase
MVSTFLSPGTVTKEHDLASLHLRRDQSLPVILSTQAVNAEHEGYAEGVVTNTRFGSYPHSTIIGAPWGSQIRASKVDTGSRGRNSQKPKKRKAETLENQENEDGTVTKDAVVASSGFVHVVPPTPENWTTSLPHRTQVVYTPDYSYILHRIRARPGSRLIEAGSGSGSFTHAAARAVFNGYPQEAPTEKDESLRQDSESTGKVFSYEYHAERHRKVKDEMAEHGLETIVRATHRDVYQDGFLLEDEISHEKTSPQANAIFLDLPAPWEALPHLTRGTHDGRPSALDPQSAVHICTFSPCIEQVQRTVTALRSYDWLDIEMVEVQHKRIDIRRDYSGLQYEGLRGVNLFAADVDQAVSKLREVERRAKDFHAGKLDRDKTAKGASQSADTNSKLPFDGGKLIHRTEPELRTHTSYLVFAVLPREWTEEDEAAEQAKWSKHVKIASSGPKTQRQLKKEAKQRAKGVNGVKGEPKVTSEEAAVAINDAPAE